MSTEQNKKLVLELLDAFNTGEIATAVSRLMADDGIWELPARGSLGYEKTKAEFVEMLGGMTQVFPGGLKMEIIGVTAEGDRVAVEAESHAQTVIGTPYSNVYHYLFIVRDGKIQYVREYLDTQHLAETFKPLWEKQPS
jgi:uncharacterized protein